MQRRKFVIGLGALTAGTAAAVGTGAFTSVTATRNIDVAVADDASAYLRLEGEDSHYVTGDGDGGTLSIDLDAGNATDAGGEGVNPNAETEFGHLFTVENQGTQEVTVTVTKQGGPDDAVRFETAAGTLGDGVTLGPGESEEVSLTVDTTVDGADANENLVDAVTFHADAN